MPRVPSPDAVLDALDPEQREVATILSGPVCVLAGAGTGKTRAITHRIAYGVHAGMWVPQHVLAVTFTARAAGEMRTRLRLLGVAGAQARTFHAAALRQLQYFWPRTIGGAVPSIAPHKAPLVAEAASRSRLALDRARIRDVAAEVEWAKVTMTTPDAYVASATRARREPPAGLDRTATARLLGVYEDVKTERGVIDFEDVLLVTAGILDESTEVLDAVRAQYRHFVVDEYQDVSPLQQRLLDLWRGDRQDVCVVGDPSQTIYSFTGASPDLLLGFTARHPGAAVVRLVRDYRSTPQVVDLANRVLRSGRRPAGSAVAKPLQLVAQRPPGPAPTLTAADDDVAEAQGIARRITALVDGGTRPAEIAVLYRTNGQSEPLEQALAEAGVPYLVRGGERFFSRREVRDAVVLLRGAARSGGAAVAQGLGADVRDVLGSGGWTAAPPSGSGAVRERWESLAALVALADELVATRPGATMADLVAELEERAAAQHAPTVDGVTLSTLHAAKGLEWDAVLLAGVSEGLLPITFAETDEQVEEERRLLYVGVTRAREHVHLSYARARTPGGRASRNASRFLDGVLGDGGTRTPPTSGRSRGARSGGTGPARCKGCGTALLNGHDRKVGRCAACPATYDEAVFASLREWRSATARAAQVPAYVVFTDATLEAIAETAPVGLGQLAGVSGVGPMKLEKYGVDVLDLLRGSGSAEVADAAEVGASNGTEKDVVHAEDVPLPSAEQPQTGDARTRVPAPEEEVTR